MRGQAERVNRRAWLLFLFVAVLWGIPYFLIKIAIDDLSPVFVVAGRTAIAALVLIPVAVARGTLSALRGRLRIVALIGVVHIIVPFLLITYGEVHISSSLTGLIIAIEPAAIALLMVRAEPLTRSRATGLVIGFAGVGVLVGLDVSGDRWGLLGAGMVLLAALSYGVATVLVQRRAAGIPPEALAGGTSAIAAVVLAPLAVLTAPRHAVVTYLNPVIAVLLGVVLLSEPLRWSTGLGFAMIAAGCWLSTRPTVAVPVEEPLPATVA
jgi:drug/metabolite transporter (DMT)-like permease